MRSSKASFVVTKTVPAAALKVSKSSPAAKSLAGSALSQKGNAKTAIPKQARIAAKIFASPTSGKAAKVLAASVLSQNSVPFPVKTYRVVGGTLTQKESAAIVRKVAKKAA